MFEVGKRYKLNGNEYVCVWANERYATLLANSYGYTEEQRYFTSFTEVKPKIKVKRWLCKVFSMNIVCRETDPRLAGGKPMDGVMWYPDTGKCYWVKEIDFEIEEGEGLGA